MVFSFVRKQGLRLRQSKRALYHSRANPRPKAFDAATPMYNHETLESLPGFPVVSEESSHQIWDGSSNFG